MKNNLLQKKIRNKKNWSRSRMVSNFIGKICMLMEEAYVGNVTYKQFQRVWRSRPEAVAKPHFYEVGAAMLYHNPHYEKRTKRGYRGRVRAASFFALTTSFDSKFWVSEGMDVGLHWGSQDPNTNFKDLLTISIKSEGKPTVKLYSKEDSRKKFVWILIHNSVVEAVKLYYEGETSQPPEVEFVTKTRTNSKFEGIIFLKGDSEKYKDLKIPARVEKMPYVIMDIFFGLIVKFWKKRIEFLVK